MNKKLYTALFTLISFVSITSFASEQKRTVAHNSLQTLIPGQCKKAIEIDGVQVHFHTPSAKSKFLVHLEATKKQEAAKRKHVFIYENQDEVWGNQEDEDSDDEYKEDETLAGRARKLREQKLAAEQENNKKQRIDSNQLVYPIAIRSTSPGMPDGPVYTLRCLPGSARQFVIEPKLPIDPASASAESSTK